MFSRSDAVSVIGFVGDGIRPLMMMIASSPEGPPPTTG